MLVGEAETEVGPVPLVDGPVEVATALAVNGVRSTKSWQTLSMHSMPQQIKVERATAAVTPVPVEAYSVVVLHELVLMVTSLPCDTEVVDGAVVSIGEVVADEPVSGKVLVYESGMGISIVIPEKIYVAVDTYD